MPLLLDAVKTKVLSNGPHCGSTAEKLPFHSLSGPGGAPPGYINTNYMVGNVILIRTEYIVSIA